MNGIKELTPGDGRGYVDRRDYWSLGSRRYKCPFLEEKALAAASTDFFAGRGISRLARPHPGHVLVAISNQQKIVCSH
jgi:hypothetical protein